MTVKEAILALGIAGLMLLFVGSFLAGRYESIFSDGHLDEVKARKVNANKLKDWKWALRALILGTILSVLGLFLSYLYIK